MLQAAACEGHMSVARFQQLWEDKSQVLGPGGQEVCLPGCGP